MKDCQNSDNTGNIDHQNVTQSRARPVAAQLPGPSGTPGNLFVRTNILLFCTLEISEIVSVGEMAMRTFAA